MILSPGGMTFVSARKTCGEPLEASKERPDKRSSVSERASLGDRSSGKSRGIAKWKWPRDGTKAYNHGLHYRKVQAHWLNTVAQGFRGTVDEKREEKKVTIPRWKNSQSGGELLKKTNTSLGGLIKQRRLESNKTGARPNCEFRELQKQRWANSDTLQMRSPWQVECDAASKKRIPSS